ncbi:MAG TPA: hypothetical protein VM925_16085 [Labilithrix sp.]|nr:hypothetical protein [Labilithrix sp.]
MDKALDLLIGKLERERLGKTTRPSPKTPPARATRDRRSSTPPPAAQADTAAVEREHLGEHGQPTEAREERSHDERESKRPRRSRDVPRSVRRAVFARDGEQCTFTDDDGRRCPSRAFLELDHVTSRALGGGHEVVN